MNGGAVFERGDSFTRDTAAFARQIAEGHAPGGVLRVFYAQCGGVALLHRKTAGNYSSTLTVNNEISVNIRLNVAGQNKTPFILAVAGGRYVPLSPHLNSEYEYHLQKTMIRNIYDTYRNLTEHTGKTVSVLMALSRLRDMRLTRADASFETHTLLRRFAEYTSVVYRGIPHPRILYETRRDSASVTERHILTENRIKQTVEADVKDAPAAALETVSRSGIKNAAEQVYKKLTEDLRRERLKKGF